MYGDIYSRNTLKQNISYRILSNILPEILLFIFQSCRKDFFKCFRKLQTDKFP